MKKNLLILGIVCLVFISGCKKNLPTSPDIPESGLPTIIHFTASPDSIEFESGALVILSWNVSHAINVLIDQGIGTVSPIGTIEVSPEETTIYTLTAKSIDGEKTASVTITVNPQAILNVVGEPQYQFSCGGTQPWGLRVQLTVENVGNMESEKGVIYFHLYSDPNAVTLTSTIGFECYSFPAGSERFIDEYLYPIPENDEGNECELVRDGCIVVELAFPDHSPPWRVTGQ